MPVLPTNLRNQLGKAIIQARRIAEAGAKIALESLAIDRHEPFSSMSIEERKLRKHLRARGRQLGDVRDSQRGTQSINRLIHEVAYEHWHRMIFARFLAENNLLIHPNHNVPVTLQEIEELARETGEDPHEIAAKYAQDLLPQIFRTNDPILKVVLTPESRQALEKLLDSLPSIVFTADDSLGWTYQYWQAEKKEEVNQSGNKIGADELPAVTQLFTEHYMVQFLYHNTIGAWHAGRVMAKNPELALTAQNEEELRQAVSLHSMGGYNFDYLRFVRELQTGDEENKPTGSWRPAGGAFDGWPETAQELKVLDPCCGSGHFLTEGLELLVRLRMDEEELSLEDSIRSVITDNLHGLEIDSRCTQIAAFNLALAAWKMIGKPMDLPAIHIACSGLAVGSTKAEWVQIAGNDSRLRAGMERLYELFAQAPELGSLINVTELKGDLLTADFSELKPLLEQVFLRKNEDVEVTERAVAAKGMALTAELLSKEYILLITNVPYLGRGQQSDFFKKFADVNYANAKADLAAIFIKRLINLSNRAGVIAVVTPLNWLAAPSYKHLRVDVIKKCKWNSLARLGSGAFQTIKGQVVSVALVVFSKERPTEVDTIFCIDALNAISPSKKAICLKGENLSLDPELFKVSGSYLIRQLHQLRNPSARLLRDSLSNCNYLSEIVKSGEGCSTGDGDRYIRKFWEVIADDLDWIEFAKTSSDTFKWGNQSNVLFWQKGMGELATSSAARIQSTHLWNVGGILIGRTGSVKFAVHYRGAFDKSCVKLCPIDAKYLAPIFTYAFGGELGKQVRKLDQRISISTNAVTQIPFDFDHWKQIASNAFPHGLPDPQSNNPSQRLFHGHPANTDLSTVLQVAVSRLIGYRWPPELDLEMRLANEAREWVARCEKLEGCIDKDGIVSLSAIRGEHSAADRLRALLSAAFKSDWSASKERELLAVAGDGKKPCISLEIWLRDKFFEEHCKLFHHRPFVWHIWDGNKSGFHCLVNAHKLCGANGEGRRTLEAITFSYLGDWIERQKADQREGKEGADSRLVAAQDLQIQLDKILEGEPPYDLFVRWKSLQGQAIGWEPDINDGIRLNIRPFMKAELRTGGKKGAGILRWKPNIKWKKDRGKEPQSIRPKDGFPWFWSCPGDGIPSDRTNFLGGTEFDGNRWNDLHYTRAVKESARANTKDKPGEN